MAAKKSEPIEIPRIDDDPRFKLLARLRRVLMDGVQRFAREIDCLIIEAEIGPATSDQQFDGNKGLLHERLLKNRREMAAEAKAAANQPSEDETKLPPGVEEALAILRGGAPRPPEKTIAARIKELGEKVGVVQEAYNTVDQAIEQLRAELSHAMALKILPEHRSSTIEMFRAMQMLAAAVDRVRDRRASMAAAGFSWPNHVLPEPSCRALLLLGSERDFSSEISRVRRILETWGFLP